MNFTDQPLTEYYEVILPESEILCTSQFLYDPRLLLITGKHTRDDSMKMRLFIRNTLTEEFFYIIP